MVRRSKRLKIFGTENMHNAKMTNTLVRGVYVVAATRGGTTVLWAVATSQSDAEITVQRALPLDWSAKLTDRRLTADQIDKLKLPPGAIRMLRPSLL